MKTDPNEVVAHLRNRMPVILLSKDYDRWLAPVDLAHLPVDLLRPFPADMMTAWKVSKAVGNVKNDDPSLISPISLLWRKNLKRKGTATEGLLRLLLWPA